MSIRADHNRLKAMSGYTYRVKRSMKTLMMLCKTALRYTPRQQSKMYEMFYEMKQNTTIIF